MQYKTIFFDLDGTLTDPAPGITNAIIYARKKWGLEAGSNEDYYKFIGPSMPQSYEEFWGFSAEEAVEFLKTYREYFGTVGLFENTVYPGIPELLAKLREEGCRLFIATTKPTDFSVRIAEKFGFAKYFEMISGSGAFSDNTKFDVIRNAKNACCPDMSSAVMVGDRLYDVEGAHQHGIPCIGVSYGYGSRKELQDAGAEFIVDSVDELAALLLS